MTSTERVMAAIEYRRPDRLPRWDNFSGFGHFITAWHKWKGLPEDGTVTSWGDDPVFKPPPQIYSTFLSITMEKDQLKAEIEHFDYDRASAIKRLREVNHPHIEDRKLWLETGLVRE